MINKLSKPIYVLALLGWGALANAASVSLVPTTPTDGVVPGDIVSFNVEVDFVAEGGTLGGGFDVSFDETQLGFVDLVSGPVGTDFGADPNILPGLLQDWAVGDFGGFDSGIVGSFSLQVLAGATSSVVALGPTTGIAGDWISNVTFLPLVPQPDYNAVEVNAVPLPAAAWLFGSALIGLAGVARRNRKA